jgi:hypothetical protein
MMNQTPANKEIQFCHADHPDPENPSNDDNNWTAPIITLVQSAPLSSEKLTTQGAIINHTPISAAKELIEILTFMLTPPFDYVAGKIGYIAIICRYLLHNDSCVIKKVNDYRSMEKIGPFDLLHHNTIYDNTHK